MISEDTTGSEKLTIPITDGVDQDQSVAACIPSVVVVGGVCLT